MKKIACITTIPNLTPRQQLQLKALKGNGFDVNVICWDRSGTFSKEEIVDDVFFLRIQPKQKADKITRKKNQAAITLWGYSSEKGPKTLAVLFGLWIRMFKQLINEKVDVIHCFHYALFPLAVLSAKIKKIQVVYDISEFNVDHALNWIPSAFRSFGKLVERFEDMLVRQVDGVTCVPDRQGMIYGRHLKNCKNIEIILNVPELESRIDQDLHSKLKLKYSGNKVVVYAGALRVNKGIMEAVKAIEKVRDTYPNIKLLLIGSSIGDDTGLIVEYITDQKLDDNVDIIPFQPYENLQTYYLCAHIGLCLPYRGKYEENLTIGNTRKNIDYIKSFLPLIVPDLGEMGLLVQQENCGLIVPTCDATSIAQAILHLLNNPSKAKEMGQNGHRAFLQRYNWNIEKKKLLNVYKAL